MFTFHGGCFGCTRQDIQGTEFCMGCCYFDADWDLPSLNNKPLSAAEAERLRLKSEGRADMAFVPKCLDFPA